MNWNVVEERIATLDAEDARKITSTVMMTLMQTLRASPKFVVNRGSSIVHVYPVKEASD